MVQAQPRVARVYAQLEQRAKRPHGESFDRLVRQAREIHGERPLATAASIPVVSPVVACGLRTWRAAHVLFAAGAAARGPGRQESA
jgi:hypothetical protein